MMWAWPVGVAQTSGNTQLSSLSLDSLEKLGWQLMVASNDALVSLSVPVLHTLANLEIDRCPNLLQLTFPVLQTVQRNLNVVDNEHLSTVNTPKLRSIGDGDGGIITFQNNDVASKASCLALKQVCTGSKGCTFVQDDSSNC